MDMHPDDLRTIADELEDEAQATGHQDLRHKSDAVRSAADEIALLLDANAGLKALLRDHQLAR